jgi:hypothetical protein
MSGQQPQTVDGTGDENERNTGHCSRQRCRDEWVHQVRSKLVGLSPLTSTSALTNSNDGQCFAKFSLARFSWCLKGDVPRKSRVAWALTSVGLEEEDL